MHDRVHDADAGGADRVAHGMPDRVSLDDGERPGDLDVEIGRNTPP